MPEFSNYVESRPPVADEDVDGSELLAASKDGEAVQLTAQQIANLGGGGGTWGSITGTLSNQTDLYGYLRGTRTVTGASASVQTDDNSLIIFNSATPFNFTLDQLTANSKITFVNYGAGAVTFVNGAGVSAVGDLSLEPANGDSFPSAVVFYDSATAPRIIKGGALTSSGRTNVVLATSTYTLDFLSKKIINFDIGTTITAGSYTIDFDNEGELVESNLSMRITGAVAFTMPSSVVMQNIEVTNGRWNSSTNVLTLTGTTASPFMVQFIPDSAGNIVCIASDRMV